MKRLFDDGLRVLAVLLAAVALARGQEEPRIEVSRELRAEAPAIKLLDRAWQDSQKTLLGLRIESIEYLEPVPEGGVEEIVDAMMEELTIPAFQRRSLNALRIVPQEALGEVPVEELERFRKSLALNVEPGDLLFRVRLRGTGGDGPVQSLNSMSPDGLRFSGSFFSMARLRDGRTVRVVERNTVCQTVVLTRYLWGAPAETIRACVRLDPETGSCKLTEVYAMPGFFSEIKTLPTEPSDAERDGRCCRGDVRWAWATGFKSISVSAGEASFHIEGHIGQSAEGFFEVEECLGG